MNFKKSVLSVFFAACVSLSLFAGTKVHPNLVLAETVTQEIRNIIKKLDLDIEKLDQTTINVKFMINDNNELIVISTGGSSFDKTIKHALNYKKVDPAGLSNNKVYIVPVRFKKT